MKDVQSTTIVPRSNQHQKSTTLQPCLTCPSRTSNLDHAVRSLDTFVATVQPAVIIDSLWYRECERELSCARAVKV